MTMRSGSHEIVDRRALLQELGVRDDGERERGAARGELLGDRFAHPIRGSDRHRGLVDDDLVLGHPPADVARGGEHVLHVRRPVFLGRRADGDELQRAVRDRGVDVGGEPESSGLHIAPDQRREAGLVDRHAAAVQGRDLGGVDVEAQHVIADFRETGAGDEADVTGADDRDLHAGVSSDALMAASAARGSGAWVIGRPTTR